MKVIIIITSKLDVQCGIVEICIMHAFPLLEGYETFLPLSRLQILILARDERKKVK